MKPCLDDNELLQLLIADDGEYPDRRTHLAECSRCAERHYEAERDAGMIARTLTQAADHLRYRESAAESSVLDRIGGGLRIAAIFCGASAFGGAAAFALLIALGWRPVVTQTEIAQASAGTIASLNGSAASNRRLAALASNGADNSLSAAGGVYNAEAITSDPLAGLVDSGSAAANSNSDEDMLFCVPGEDGTICSSSAEQG
jgi:hypothetical protein